MAPACFPREGVVAAVSTVSNSGNVDIDGLLSGYRWASGSITYSFTTSSSQYGYSVPGFQAFNAAQQSATIAALANYAAVANLTFTQVSGGTGTLRFAESSDPDTAYAYYPHSSEIGGDAFFNRTDYNTADEGTYSYLTFLHEIGHTLGLDHGQDGSGALPTDHDSLEYSVMTYRSFVGADLTGYTVDEGSYPLTLMLADIAALQYIYGANFSTNAGNSTYKWNPSTGAFTINGVAKGQSTTNTVFMTVWDGGGTDTYDFSLYSSSLKINLTPGEWSTTSTTQLADLGMGETARGNIANAWLYQNNTASLIENAIGGSGNDLIVGNETTNVLKGGNGNDSLKGLEGNDTIWGGQGNDTAYFAVASTACIVTYDASAEAYIVTAAGIGTDTVKEIEFFAFTDKTVTAGVISPDAPVLVSATPADGATNVKDDANIVLTFSEDIFAGTGNVVIRQSDGTLFQTFDIGSSPAGVTIDGNTVTIDPSGFFKAGTGYYVTIEGGAFEDDEDKPFSGIASKSDLNFMVEQGIARGTKQSETIGGTKYDDTILAGGGNDAITGRSGNDSLDGGSGADNMAGGRGDDTYKVNNRWDKVVEADDQGNDLVKSSVSFTLPANVEKLKITGSANIDGTGNGLANTITGNSGKNELFGLGGRDSLFGGSGGDWLDGGNGRDTLTGGAGADKFVFCAAVKSSNADLITDFSVDHDTIVFSRKVFKALALGTITDEDAAYSTDGDAGSAHIIYDSATGGLFYDRDGAGSAGDVKVATLSAGLVFTLDNFLVV
jgi:serralysin